ncbi:MAG: bifunctional GlmU protein [Deltaproteobacteria bacterium RIFOXYD12_FULL_57_12]|nr:MAG: bifunctional GlmU protein [Deltaproteobacteria bacterium RIFOXYD12_FULL_57_12]
MLAATAFFDLAAFAHRELFRDTRHAWEALTRLKSYMAGCRYPELSADLFEEGVPLTRTLVWFNKELLDSRGLDIDYGDATKGRLLVRRHGQLLEGASVIMAGAVLLGRQIDLGHGVLVEAGALIKSPTIIGDYTEIRQGAYLRGHCLAGRGCVIGHVTEVKHTIFLNEAKAGHFAYLGDSILGNQVNLGAGTKLANLRFTGGTVPVKTPAGPIDTGLSKLGAILGDQVQTGCNSVTNPGCLLGKKSLVMPNSTVPSGYHANNTLIR